MALQLNKEPPETIAGCPIRSNISLSEVRAKPSTLNEEGRERLRKMARDAAKEPFREPYVIIRSELTEGNLPLIRGTLTLRGVNSIGTDPACELKNIYMLLHTGCHRTLITDDLLPDSFKQHLNDPLHDPYRNFDEEKGIMTLQVSCDVAFTNAMVSVGSIALIVPRRIMPNQRSEVLLGQIGCLDRLNVQCMPRELLKAKGESIEEGIWGDILFKEYVDMKLEVYSI